MGHALRLRRMGEAGILFDEQSWETHILTPTAVIIFEAMLEHTGGQPVSVESAARFLRDALELDPAKPEIARLTAMFRNLGLIH